jgi:hypothetical protein
LFRGAEDGTMTAGMSLPIDDEVEHGILTQLAGAGDTAALCASCLVAALEVTRQRLMGALRRLLVRSLVHVRVNRCTRCGEAGLAVQRPPSR